MTPALSSFEQPGCDAFREEVRAFISAAIPAEWHEHLLEMRREWERSVFAAGFAGLSWPAEHGGRGLGPIEELIYYEEAGRAHAPDELNSIGKYVSGPSIMAHGTVEQQRRYLPRILAAEEIWCEGFSEPDAGSDLAAASTRAVPDGEQYRLVGRKIWTSNAHLADRCYLLAKTSQEAPRHHNLSMFLVDMHQSGIEIVPIRQITGESEFNEVLFDGAVVSREDLLGEENDGWRLASVTGFRSARQAISSLRRYVQIREWLDLLTSCCGRTGVVPDSELADLQARGEVVRWHAMRTIELMVNEASWYPTACVLQLWWSGVMQDVTERGMLTGCPFHRHFWRQSFLETRAASIYGGTSQIQRNVVADRVLGLPR